MTPDTVAGVVDSRADPRRRSHPARQIGGSRLGRNRPAIAPAAAANAYLLRLRGWRSPGERRELGAEACAGLRSRVDKWNFTMFELVRSVVATA
jgi:hypothetical protein